VEPNSLQIRRALLTVSDKSKIKELGQALVAAGAEIVATGNTARILEEAGIKVTPIEQISGSPESFQGRMKTLSFNVLSGILYRRGNGADETDLKKLNVKPIDCVVVNFYPFEAASAKKDISESALIEEIDIGGPSLVRAAAKNSPNVLVLTDPSQYDAVIGNLKESKTVPFEIAKKCASDAWEKVRSYDVAIAQRLGPKGKLALRYGENPHQTGFLEIDPSSPIRWSEKLTPTELSYNNILDVSSAYALAADLVQIDPLATSVVIVKHNNPCGVASVPKNDPRAQIRALEMAWAGDPVSAFGGVLVFSDPLTTETLSFISEHFIELVAAPKLTAAQLSSVLVKRKNLKAVEVLSFEGVPVQSAVNVPGGILHQSTDRELKESFKSVTKITFPETKVNLACFGVAVCRSLKSNAIAIVRETSGCLQLLGAGQGQPNRIDAIKILAIPRAKSTLKTANSEKDWNDSVMISDAFFPFRDAVDEAHAAGLKWIIQPGGSIKDAESIKACDEFGIGMAFTGTRHFKH
jgi:phosphoribosylaminoimidazolecarboxamide formyltransferase/IMP cyclohydrolase